MTLEVIGPGFGRTGTLSTKAALERLGFSKCHHMVEVLENREQIDIIHAAARGEPTDWAALFRDYRAQLDWPCCAFWRELTDAFPEARVVLTVRHTESWLRSINETILPRMRALKDVPPDMRAWADMVRAVIVERTFGGEIDDLGHVAAVYERHNEEVISTVPRDRLLVYDVRYGWDPLCRFFRAPTPDEPFPRTNSAAEFNALVDEIEGRR